MRIALVGATGGTGQEILKQSLTAGYTVTVLVREPTKIAVQDQQLTIVEGNVLDQSAVDRVVTGADAVVVALGNTANNPEMVVSTGTERIIDAMRRQGVRRLVVISSLGVGDSKRQVPFGFKLLSWTILRKTMKDKEAQEAAVRESGLDWTIIRPGGLTDDPRTGNYRVGTDSSIQAGRIARADVADFVLRELEQNAYVGMTPAIT
ncbi:MAG: SDR family oxidoreductase [Caldilineaceae bacterium]